MIIKKVRGKNEIHPIILTSSEVAVIKKMGVSIERYVKRRIEMVAKQRKWKWYFEKEKANEHAPAASN